MGSVVGRLVDGQVHAAASPPPPDSRAATTPDHFDGGNSAKFDAVERLAAIAAQAGVSLTHLAHGVVRRTPGGHGGADRAAHQEQLEDLLGAAELRLDADTLDAIDAVVAPGTDVNPDDAGWTPPGLAVTRRRRAR